MGSMVQWLTLLAYSLPELFGLAIALALLATSARPGPARRLGMIGIGAMLGVSLLGLGLSVYQQILIANAAGDHVSIQRMFSLLSAIRIALNLISMGGLLAVVWGLCSATRAVATEDDRLKSS
jgi:hypothetical protein